jgi:hypothetical protein
MTFNPVDVQKQLSMYQSKFSESNQETNPTFGSDQRLRNASKIVF